MVYKLPGTTIYRFSRDEERRILGPWTEIVGGAGRLMRDGEILCAAIPDEYTAANLARAIRHPQAA